MKDNIYKVLTAPWMIDRQFASAYLPLVGRMLQGDPIAFREYPVPRPFAMLPGDEMPEEGQGTPLTDAESGSVAVYPIEGVITKKSTWCSMGTEDLMREMRRAEQMDNITAHLLKIDSGGGEGTNIETVARFLALELEKPVLAWVNGYCASAAYYLAAACDKIYASQGTDILGSVGVMLSFMDYREYYEQKGIKLHEVYSRYSDLKNEDFRQARDGAYEKVRDKLLDPMAEQFIRDVSLYRFGTLIDDDRIYRGDTFLAKEGIELGMLDGIQTFDQTVEKAVEASEKKKKLKLENTMKMKNIITSLGYALELDENGGAYLQGEELQKLSDQLPSDEEETVATSTLDDLRNQLAAQEEKINDLATLVEALDAELRTKLSQKDFDAFKVASAARPTEAFVPENPGQEHVEQETELEKITKEMAATGGPFRVVK